MTREEAIARIRIHKNVHKMDEPRAINISEALDMAIKALEQKPCEEQNSILDKIRAEIKALSPKPTAYDVIDGNPVKDAVWETIADVLKIIDKYRTESEG